MSTGSGGGRITLKPLRDGRAVTSGWEWVERALRALVLLLGTNQALVSVPGVFTSLGVHRETCGFTGNALFCLPLKSPPWDGGEEEPGVLMQQHPALPALRSALSDKRARRNRHGEHSQRHANGHCLFFFFFFHQKYKSTHHILQLWRLRFIRSRAVVLLQLCSPSSSVEQLSAPDGSLSFVLFCCLSGFFFCRDREFDDLKTNNPPKNPVTCAKILRRSPQNVPFSPCIFLPKPASFWRLSPPLAL